MISFESKPGYSPQITLSYLQNFTAGPAKQIPGLNAFTVQAKAPGPMIDLRSGTSGNDNIIGSNAPDTLNGFGGDDIIQGLVGNDFIRGGTGNDTLYGDEDDDTLWGEDGDDTLYGGDGDDMLSGFDGDDTLWGGAGNDSLGGNYGDDTLWGGTGDDILLTGSDIEVANGVDTIDGGSGTDTLQTSFRLLAGRINGITGEVFDVTGTRVLATFTSIENFTVDNDVRVDGTNDDNIIIASHTTGTNILVGNGGDDFIDGGGGDDTILGGAGDDILRGGAGADDMQGGSGINTLDYTGSSDGVTIDLLAGTAQGGDAQGDTYGQISNVIGSGGNDVLTGDQSDNILDGLNGTNTLDGGDGNDTLISGSLADTLIGGSGSDTVSYENSTSGVHIDIGTNTISGGYADGDTLSSIENITGSSFDDFIHATVFANVLDGGDGIDTLSYSSTIAVTVNLQTGFTSGGWSNGDTISNFENLIGSSRNDTLIGSDVDNEISGGNGNDFITGGAGADDLYGGNGIDDVLYTSSDAAVSVSLEAGFGSGGHAQGDTLDRFENLWGSAFDDQLIGSNLANHILGQNGNDTIEGLAGADVLNGGNGLNTLSYEHSSGAVTINLFSGHATGGHANGDLISNFINLTGSIHDDTLSGNSDGNIINAGAGDDTIYADAGADVINGDLGNDTLSYENSDTAITLNLDTGTFAGGFAEGDSVTGVENFAGSDHDDTVIAGSGAHDIDAGNGIDTLSYENSSTAVTVILGSIGVGGDAEGDRNSNFEILIGSDFNDFLIGRGGLDETIEGGLGNDQISGSTGADTLSGGLGIDTLNYGSSSAGVEVNLSTNSVSGGDSEGDIISGFESLVGSLHNDELTGDAGSNTITGNSGHDIIVGGLGNDVIFGGDGDDIINGGSGSSATNDGADEINAGNGDDIINYLGVSTSSLHVDTIDGGDGIDTYTIANINSLRIVDLSSGQMTTSGGSVRAHLSNIENVIVSGSITVIGDNESNTIRATSTTHANTLMGSGGEDIIDAGGGDDVIFGGQGKDTLTGGTGSDRFVFSVGDGNDTITDFEVKRDKIDLNSVDPYTSFLEFQTMMTDHGTYVIIDLGNGDMIRLEDVDISQLSETHFSFGGDHADGNGPFRDGHYYYDDGVDKSVSAQEKPDTVPVSVSLSPDSDVLGTNTFEFKDTPDTTIIADVLSDEELWDVEGWNVADLRDTFLANLPSSDISTYVDTDGYLTIFTEDDHIFYDPGF